jgi:hypothetical protein
MELASGFVVALLLASILLMDRLGGDDEWGRRIYQIALGAALAIAVATTVTAFVFDDVELNQTFGNDGSDWVNRFVVGNALNLACGFIALLLGLARARQWSTIPSGMILGGVLLIVAGGSSAGSASPDDTFYTNLLIFGTDASFVARALLVSVSIGGFLILFAFGYDRYERLGVSDGDDDELEEEPGGL